MANFSGDDLVRDLRRFTGDPSCAHHLLAGLGRALWARPSPEALMALLADIDACRHRLDVDTTDTAARELSAGLSAATTMLATYLDAARSSHVPDTLKHQVLRLVAEADGVTPAQVADELARPRPQIIQTLEDLSELGWVSARSGHVDGKARIYRATPEGTSQLRRPAPAT